MWANRRLLLWPPLPRMRLESRHILSRSRLSSGASATPEEVVAFLEQGLTDIPLVVWPLYEVVGAERVGIPCRCGVGPSLNAKGACSGIIARPMQSKCDGWEPEMVSAKERTL